MHLILASSSPRRRELLLNAGFAFEVQASSVDETPLAGERPEEVVERLARSKALEVAVGSTIDSLVLGADTVVVTDENELLNKPANGEEAAQMLRRLSGRRHQVLTGVALVKPPTHVLAVERAATDVWFRELDEDEIVAYVASGESLDKAGAYGVQGMASRFVTRIEGCYFNVVGLPVSLVDSMLRAAEESPELEE